MNDATNDIILKAGTVLMRKVGFRMCSTTLSTFPTIYPETKTDTAFVNEDTYSLSVLLYGVMKVPQSQPNDNPSIIIVALIGISIGSFVMYSAAIPRTMNMDNPTPVAI
ncbi:MAG: hypothetical protein WCI11_16635 [Candidatus Methylumidiphilus sp.]